MGSPGRIPFRRALGIAGCVALRWEAPSEQAGRRVAQSKATAGSHQTRGDMLDSR